MDYLRLKNLAVGYNGRALIKNIEIGVRRGEIVTLVGPNGSGKSTILKSIAKQLEPVSGSVELEGRGLEGYGPLELAKKMAVMLTGRIQPELMTCRDIASMGRYPYTGRLGILSDEDEALVEKALACVHAQSFADRPFDAVSDGERQRVLLARAICQEPEIIILDEPTSYLDIRHKLELLSILRSMAKNQGITVVMSLHEIDLAMKISDRVICVGGEEIFACGAPEDVLTDDVIRELYGLINESSPAGFFDSLAGSVELAPPEGKPDIFVLSSGGTGIPVYRKLQREGRPFIAGILYKNDIDWHTARLLASEVIEEGPFEEISDRAYSRALECVRRCSRVIDAGVHIGSCNRRMADLIAEAERLGKLEKLRKLKNCWRSCEY